jgi:LL-diaminopimelate aminotransferase
LITSRRINSLQPYLFAEIDRIIAEKRASGIEVIDFGIGDPDLPTPDHIVKTLCEEAKKPENHRYPSYEGMIDFREAVAAWIYRRFGVSLHPEKEVLALIGAKEGIAHFPLTCINEGDVVLVPDPAYPVYGAATLLCGGVSEGLPLSGENGYLPDLSAISKDIWQKARLLFLNYPNNPTGGVATMSFFEEVLFYANKYEVIVAHDNAYSEITFDAYVAPSILQVPGSKENVVEFHSLSKTYNMTGWRIGYAIGGEKVIEAFRKVKTNIDSGVFNPIQRAGIAALEGPDDCIKENVLTYRNRRDFLVNGLREMGWRVDLPKATPYVWMRVPEGYDSGSFTRDLLEKAAVVVAPGSSYGANGEGYVRFSLTIPTPLLEEGVRRIKASFS